ncbi:tyrosine-type recombinase/integrase [Flavonifractor plautii]|jgi:integrase/recombinase XerD|uniref:Tyrosine-type recombinase/integrase n=2 Tax=Flavonifractor plautii TaxID=292800 RepID=A0A6I2R0E8_FLAPL|nr:tyrosine-type recombinase/integrase [Flavonifractor plautii]
MPLQQRTWRVYCLRLSHMRYKRKRDKCFWTMARSYLHDYMPAIRNLSGKTIETYKQSLKTYLRFLKEKKNIEDELVSFEAFTRDYVKEFIIWLKGQGASTRTINLRITSIRSFLKYCGQEDFELRGIYESVCQIQKLKEEKHPILYLQPEATAAILSAYDMNTQKHRRNRMILILLYDTGARVQELADLDIESLHLDVPNPYISIIGKGRKRRNVPIMRKTVAHLNSYLKEFHPSEQSAPLFYSMRDGKPHRLSTDSISLVVGTAAKMARETCNAVPENVHCHLFRKTKAMDLYKNGIPLPFIMQLLGHESMSTTSGFYAFATLEMMSDAINKSVPIIGGTEKLWKNKNAKQALYTLD